MLKKSFPLPLLLIFLAALQSFAQEKSSAPDLKPGELGTTKNVHQCDSLYLAGQFSKEDIATIKKAGIKKVISLRAEKEINWDEAAALKEAGIEFVRLPVGRPDAFTDELFDSVRKSVQSESPVLLHCGSATRVAYVWLPYRVLDQGVDLETALAEVKKVASGPKFMEDKAVAYIKKRQDEKAANPKMSVKPGINKSFLNPELNVDEYVKRFEIESREVYSSRLKILAACDIEEGDTVADVGAGTGLFTQLFSVEVGDGGWVYAVDIAPRFLKHIQKTATENKRKNITGVLCPEDSVSLPANSVDVVFICDTYHHFEFPNSTMNSIHRALKKDGHLIMIDFNRIEGQTREWLLNHVRAGKETFQKEIQESGFELVEEKQIPGFKENYFLKFKKK